MKQPDDVQTTPAGHEIVFYEKKPGQQRRYLVDGKRLPSVTTIIGVLDKSAPLMAWAVRLTKEGKDYRTERDEAGQRGRAAHDLIVRMMAEGREGRLSELDEAHRPWGQAAAAWLLDRRPNLLFAERMVVGPGYVGRFDLLCELDGTPTLIDFKTRGKPEHKSPYPEEALQLNGYALALEHSGYSPPEAMAVVGLYPDGTFAETAVPIHTDRFLAVMGARQAREETRRELRANREEAGV